MLFRSPPAAEAAQPRAERRRWKNFVARETEGMFSPTPMRELAARWAATTEDEKSEFEGVVEVPPAAAPVSVQIGPAETPYGVGDYMWPGRPNLMDEVVAGLDV